MAENESLDLGGPYAKRWDVVCEQARKGASAEHVASKFEDALVKGLRSALKQCIEKGVTPAELLDKRDSPQDLHQLLRKMHGHDYIRLLVENAAVCGPTPTDCLAGWVEAVVDKVTDQICHRVAGTENYPTMGDALEFMDEVRHRVSPAVDRIVAKLAEDPNWLPSRARTGGQIPVNNTAELMDLSLLGAPSQ